MNRKTFFILFSLALVACNQDNNLQPTDDKPTSHVNIVATQSSPYLNLYQSESEMIAHLVYTDCGFKDRQSSSVYERNLDANTIYVDKDNKVGITIADTYKMDTTSKNKTIFNIQRDVTVISNRQEKNVVSRLPERRLTASTGFSMTVREAEPITILRPHAFEDQLIPQCYYEDMEIEWNPDYENHNGVVVIIEWNGIMLQGDNFNNTNVVGIDIVDDDGVATLSNQIFDDIPDGALVNLWLLRGNIVELIEDGQELGIDDLRHILEGGTSNEIEEYLENNPDLMMQLQQTTVVCGSYACFTFYLVRNL